MPLLVFTLMSESLEAAYMDCIKLGTLVKMRAENDSLNSGLVGG